MKTLKFLAILAAFAMIATTSCKKDKTYNVTFEVKADGQLVDGAKVKLDTEEKTTENGEVTFEGIKDGTYDYTVTLADYEKETGTITVDGGDVIEKVKMTATKYTITFVVKEGDEPLKDAEVKVGEKTEKTDAAGKAEFTLAPGDITYSVTKELYVTINGTLKVEKDDEIPVAMELTPLSAAVEFIWEKTGQQHTSYMAGDKPAGICFGYHQSDNNIYFQKDADAKKADKWVNLTGKDVTTKAGLIKAVTEGAEIGDGPNAFKSEIMFNGPTTPQSYIFGTKIGTDYFLIKIIQSSSSGTPVKTTLKTTWQE